MKFDFLLSEPFNTKSQKECDPSNSILNGVSCLAAKMSIRDSLTKILHKRLKLWCISSVFLREGFILNPQMKISIMNKKISPFQENHQFIGNNKHFYKPCLLYLKNMIFSSTEKSWAVLSSTRNLIYLCFYTLNETNWTNVH